MEIIDLLKEFVKPELLILIPVLYLLGVAFKNTKKMPDEIIPLTLGIISILLSVLYIFATSDVHNGKEIAMAIFTSITQGILVAGCSVYFNQIYKQLKK